MNNAVPYVVVLSVEKLVYIWMTDVFNELRGVVDRGLDCNFCQASLQCC